MYKQPLFRLIAQQVSYYHDSTNVFDHTLGNMRSLRHEYALESLMKHMPSGSGIDSGTKLLLEDSSKDKLVFQVDYHHMNSNGYYCGWSSRLITITPSLTSAYNMEFSAEDYSGVDCEDSLDEHPDDSDCKEGCQSEDCFTFDNTDFIQDSTEDYLADTYRYALEQEYELTLADYEPTKLGFHGELVI